MEINQIKKIVNKAKIKKEFIYLFVAAIAFSFVFYLTFFQSSPSEEEISEYSKSLESDYGEYNSRINSANVNIENLVNSEQVKKMEYYGRLIEEKNYSKEKNPFVKTQ